MYKLTELSFELLDEEDGDQEQQPWYVEGQAMPFGLGSSGWLAVRARTPWQLGAAACRASGVGGALLLLVQHFLTDGEFRRSHLRL